MPTLALFQLYHGHSFLKDTLYIKLTVAI